MVWTPAGKWPKALGRRRRRQPAMVRTASPRRTTASPSTTKPDVTAGLPGAQRTDGVGHTPPGDTPESAVLAPPPATAEVGVAVISRRGAATMSAIASTPTRTPKPTRLLMVQGYRLASAAGQRGPMPPPQVIDSKRR
jgi:hypothetical protein